MYILRVTERERETERQRDSRIVLKLRALFYSLADHHNTP